jgi:hypothetical protein
VFLNRLAEDRVMGRGSQPAPGGFVLSLEADHSKKQSLSLFLPQ